MPQLYNHAVITDVGISLLNRAQAGEVSIQFTRMAVGNGIYSEEEKTLSQLQKSTSLRSEKNSYPLSSVNIVSDNSVKLTAIITNQDLVTGENLVANGYYINEMGLYAKEKDGDSSTEVLYSIVTTAGENGDYMPPYNGHTPAQIIQEYYTTISSSEDVTIYLKDTGALMLAEDAEKRFQEVLEAIPPVDSELSKVSENPVQNKIVTKNIEELNLKTEDKVDKAPGMGLSSNDYTITEKEKLGGIQAGATNTPKYAYMVGNAGGYIDYGVSKSVGYRKLLTINAGLYANGYFAFTAFRRGGDSTRYCLNFDEYTGLLLSFRGYTDKTAQSVNADSSYSVLTPPSVRSTLYLVKVSETSGSGGVYDIYMYCTPWGSIRLCNIYAPFVSTTFHLSEDIVVTSLPTGYIECTESTTPIN